MKKFVMKVLWTVLAIIFFPIIFVFGLFGAFIKDDPNSYTLDF